MMISGSPIENKFLFILTFASATPFERPRDPQVGKPWTICCYHLDSIQILPDITHIITGLTKCVAIINK